MNVRTLIKRSTILILAALLCLGVGAVCPGVAYPSALAYSDTAQPGAAKEANPQDKAKGRGETSVKSPDTGNQEPHWSVFNLTASLLSLLIALALIARLGIAALRDDQLEADAWERLKAPQTLADMEEAAVLHSDRDGRSKGIAVFDGQMTALNQLCTSVCVGLALVSIIVFFIVERFDAPMVILDILSPLFGILLVLTLLGAIFSLLSGSGVVAFERQSGSETFDEDEGGSDDEWL
jgi:hypothetical protein